MSNTTTTTTTTTAAAELPNELIDEILLRLPVKSLMRFKTVSKQWLSLITNHRFALRHHSLPKAPNLTSFFLSSNMDFINPLSVRLNGSIKLDSYIKLPLPARNRHKPGPPVLVSAGFGIYCVFRYFIGAFHLWNPATAEWIRFPPPPRDFQTDVSLFFAKVEYCEDGVFSYKVGIVSLTEELFGEFGGRHTLTLELYSSKTKTWKVMPHVYYAGISYKEDVACVNLNGKAHWFTYCSVGEKEAGCISTIITFDYENEVLGFIPIRLAPEVGKYYDMTNCILSLWDDEFLCLVLCWEKDDSLFIDIWVLREYGVDESWSKEFTLGPFSIDTKVLGFSSKLHVIFSKERSSYPFWIKMYDYKTASVKELRLPYKYNQNLRHQELLIKEHVESIISLAM